MSKIENTVSWIYILLMILKVKKLLEHLIKKNNCKKQIKKNLT